MGRFGDGWRIYDEIADLIADRLDDFDRETIEDLMDAIGPENLYKYAVEPMIDKVIERIGLGNLPKLARDPTTGATKDQQLPPANPLAPSVANTLPNAPSENIVPGEAAGTVAMVQGKCPHCESTFLTTLEAVMKEESDTCLHCGKDFIQSGTLKANGPEGAGPP